MAKTLKLNNTLPDEPTSISKAAEQSKAFNFSKKDFAKNTKVILRDMNNNPPSPTFTKYSKTEILEYLKDPAANEQNIRDAVIYMYGASSRFYRIIQYFVGLTDLSWYLSPYNIDVAEMSGNIEKYKKNRIKTLKFLSSMNLKTQGKEILTVCMREDVYYATCWVNNDSITIQQLPSNYCSIASIEGNVSNVTFDFSYFRSNQKLLPLYPPEFTTKYNLYQKNGAKFRYQDLDSPTSFAIKVNKDIKNYAIPPLAGVLIALYDLADYQSLKLTKTELENYALLVMKLGMHDGEWDLDFNVARDFWSNLSNVTPEQIGGILSPMDIEKIDFKQSGATDADKVAEAESTIFSEAGVSSLLFNNPKASANALALSIKADQALVFSVVQSLEDALNRLLHHQSFSKQFKITFVDSSPYNRKEMADHYLKAATYGLPTISAYCATVGLTPDEVEGLNFLENDMLGLIDKFRPLKSSNTMSGENSGDNSEGEDSKGRPQAEDDELTEEGENSREKQ